MTVSGLTGGDPREVDALVDTGSRRSMLPGDLLARDSNAGQVEASI